MFYAKDRLLLPVRDALRALLRARVFDMSTDSHLCSTRENFWCKGEQGEVPLYEGRMVHWLSLARAEAAAATDAAQR